MQQRLAELSGREDQADHGLSSTIFEHQEDIPSVAEYCALETVQTSANFYCIAQARTEPRQRREADDAVHILEGPVAAEGDPDDGDADGQIEAAAARAQSGLATFGATVAIPHHFPPDKLKQILNFTTAERTQRFVKDLMATDLMKAGELPTLAGRDAQSRRRTEVLQLKQRYAPLGDPTLNLKAIAELQQKSRGKADEAAPPPEEPAEVPDAPAAQPPPEPVAYFTQSYRPSDYVAHLAKEFEAGPVDATTGQRQPRMLRRDQTLFLAQFAKACNAIWDDEKDQVAPKARKTFQILLMGQGGSGKTAIVQEIVLPAMDKLFPPAAPDYQRSTLIVCAKWSQAENISTKEHKAVSCHRAALMGIGTHRNKSMLPQDNKAALERRWSHLRALIIEEVSMVSPNLYNMLLYRGFHGRRDKFNVPEGDYMTRKGAFGRMPLVIMLGDFLQLRPTGTGISLLSDLQALETAAGDDGPPAEHQQAMKFFCQTPLCFEFQASNRFKDEKLRKMMDFMRAPKPTVPVDVAATWQEMQIRPADARLREERFQHGHMLAWFWDTVARWIMMRAKRDAANLQDTLYLVQAADTSEPPMAADLAAKLMNQPNPGDTGGIHGMLPLHVGMRIRLLEHLDLEKGLVKDAEGDIVHVAINPADEQEVLAARRDGRPAYLRYLPFGVWVRMDKYTSAPFCEVLEGVADTLDKQATQSLVFIAPQTSTAFTWRKHKVTRTGWPFSHGRVVTSTACQGRTMRLGVIIDAGCKDPNDKDNWWLHLYVMLSRATSAKDILLARAPPVDFLTQGPPADLAAKLRTFAARTAACRHEAKRLACELGLAAFLH